MGGKRRNHLYEKGVYKRLVLDTSKSGSFVNS